LTKRPTFATLVAVKENFNGHAPHPALRSFEQLKLLADPRRLAILRQLMAGPASLTMLGKALGEHPAWVRHPGLIQLGGAVRCAMFEERLCYNRLTYSVR